MPCLVPLYNILLTDKKSSKLLKWIMINVFINIMVITFLYTTHSKIYFIHEFYAYVYLFLS